MIRRTDVRHVSTGYQWKSKHRVHTAGNPIAWSTLGVLSTRRVYRVSVDPAHPSGRLYHPGRPRIRSRDAPRLQLAQPRRFRRRCDRLYRGLYVHHTSNVRGTRDRCLCETRKERIQTDCRQSGIWFYGGTSLLQSYVRGIHQNRMAVLQSMVLAQHGIHDAQLVVSGASQWLVEFRAKRQLFQVGRQYTLHQWLVECRAKCQLFQARR